MILVTGVIARNSKELFGFMHIWGIRESKHPPGVSWIDQLLLIDTDALTIRLGLDSRPWIEDRGEVCVV